MQAWTVKRYRNLTVIFHVYIPRRIHSSRIVMNSDSVRRTRAPALSLLSAVLLSTLAAVPGHALTVGADELRAAKGLGCVLADDALGYLSEEQFNQRFDETVAGLSAEQEDVAYATALGYIDGLLFGVPSGNQRAATERLQAFSESEACSRFVAVRADSVSL